MSKGNVIKEGILGWAKLSANEQSSILGPKVYFPISASARAIVASTNIHAYVGYDGTKLFLGLLADSNDVPNILTQPDSDRWNDMVVLYAVSGETTFGNHPINSLTYATAIPFTEASARYNKFYSDDRLTVCNKLGSGIRAAIVPKANITDGEDGRLVFGIKKVNGKVHFDLFQNRKVTATGTQTMNMDASVCIPPFSFS